MTEYWVSQGNKWCDFCKIYIANNPVSIRTHELGQRHKDNVAKRLESMRKDNIAKEKAQKDAARALEQIEAKAKRSYQKDLAAFREAKDSKASASGPDENSLKTAKPTAGDEWELDSASGYYYNQTSGYHYDPNSGLYYSDAIGKWVTTEEAYSSNPPPDDRTLSDSKGCSKPNVAEDKPTRKASAGPPPGQVVSAPLKPMRSIKGAPSSIAVNKRKRVSDKPNAKSKEEEDALKAREAAKKRVEAREAPLLGLYKSY